MRGWLCRRKWKTIVQDYICSPHAESMRKRNQIVFNMVEAESEYVHQLYVLVNCFLRPLRMAASSKKPPISHDDVSSIFLNRYRGPFWDLVFVGLGGFCGFLFGGFLVGVPECLFPFWFSWRQSPGSCFALLQVVSLSQTLFQGCR